MKLTVQELNIIIDTLIGSTNIIDRTDLVLFKYSLQERDTLAQELIVRADAIHIGVDTE